MKDSESKQLSDIKLKMTKALLIIIVKRFKKLKR